MTSLSSTGHVDSLTFNTSLSTFTTEEMTLLSVINATDNIQNMTYDNTTDVISEGAGLSQATNPCATFDLLVPIVLLSVLVVSGLFGNTISIAIMWRDRNRSNIALLLIVLAFTDELVLGTRFLMNALPTICKYFNIGSGFLQLHRTYLLAYMWGFITIIQMADSYVIILLAVNRYLAVKVPHVYKVYGDVKYARLQAFGVYLFSALFNLTRFFEFEVVSDDRGQLKSIKTSLGKNAAYLNIYKIPIYLSIVYILPIITLMFFTYKLVTSIREANRRRKQMTKKDQEKNNVTATLVSIVVIFMICHLAISTRRLMQYFYPVEQRKCPGFYYYWTSLFPAIVCTNSAVNFFIYCWFSPQFRVRVVQLFCKAEPAGDELPLFSSDKRLTHGSSKVTPLSSVRGDALVAHTSQEQPQLLELSG